MNFDPVFAIAAAGIFLNACTEDAVNKDIEAQILMDLSRQWSAQVSSGDMESALSVWADDAVMLPPDLPLLDGKAVIEEYVTGAANIPGFQIRWEPLEAHVSNDGDMAYMLERNVIEVDGPDGNKIITHSKVVTIWRKNADGEWKNVVDIWNTAPAPID